MHESTVRKRRLRAKRRQEGWEQYELWLPARTAGRLADIRRPGEPWHALIDRLLDAWERKGPPGLSYEERFPVLMARIWAMRIDEKLSHQAIADRLNAEHEPTLSGGKGQWQAGTVGKLLAQAKAAQP
jgi:hypothetical protein